MEIDPRNHPSRAFIRFTAQTQLQADLTGQPITVSVQRLGKAQSIQQIASSDSTASTSEASQDFVLDAALFEEIAKTAFSENRYPELYQACASQKAASEVEARVAAEIVAAYKQIKQNQQCPVVQRLNNLL